MLSSFFPLRTFPLTPLCPKYSSFRCLCSQLPCFLQAILSLGSNFTFSVRPPLTASVSHCNPIPWQYSLSPVLLHSTYIQPTHKKYICILFINYDYSRSFPLIHEARGPCFFTNTFQVPRTVLNTWYAANN